MPKARKNLRTVILQKGRDVLARRSSKWALMQSEKELPVQKRYSTEDMPYPLNRNFTPGKAKLRASITPGTVLIVLAGRFRGKRVVFLKQLESGLLLVTGPYKVNGVPLRRVNQAYVIATSTKLDVSGVKLGDNINDAFFKAPATEGKSGEERFFSAEPKKPEISQALKDAQKSVDTAILSKLDKVTKAYLNAKFSLTRGQYPHAMSF